MRRLIYDAVSITGEALLKGGLANEPFLFA
jgi:hypothetical protein